MPDQIKVELSGKTVSLDVVWEQILTEVEMGIKQTNPKKPEKVKPEDMELEKVSPEDMELDADKQREDFTIETEEE